MKNINISSLPISQVVFFKLNNGKYLATNGEEITTEMLLNYEHVIFDGMGYIIVKKDKIKKIWD